MMQKARIRQGVDGEAGGSCGIALYGPRRLAASCDAASCLFSFKVFFSCSSLPLPIFF